MADVSDYYGYDCDYDVRFFLYGSYGVLFVIFLAIVIPRPRGRIGHQISLRERMYWNRKASSCISIGVTAISFSIYLYFRFHDAYASCCGDGDDDDDRYPACQGYSFPWYPFIGIGMGLAAIAKGGQMKRTIARAAAVDLLSNQVRAPLIIASQPAPISVSVPVSVAEPVIPVAVAVPSTAPPGKYYPPQ